VHTPTKAWRVRLEFPDDRELRCTVLAKNQRGVLRKLRRFARVNRYYSEWERVSIEEFEGDVID